jgi:hypothetical protein
LRECERPGPKPDSNAELCGGRGHTPVKVITVSAPRLEMRVAVDASIWCRVGDALFQKRVVSLNKAKV